MGNRLFVLEMLYSFSFFLFVFFFSFFENEVRSQPESCNPSVGKIGRADERVRSWGDGGYCLKSTGVDLGLMFV